jgi:hypothetical protein
MRKSAKHLWMVFFALLAGLLLFNSGFLKLSAQEPQDKKPSSLPVMDYETEVSKAVSEGRRKTSARFNNPNVNPMPIYRHIAELPDGMGGRLPTSNHWWQGMPALPVAQSDVIVAGKVVDAQAHMSDDRTEIYSEYSVEVSDIFKNNGDPLDRTISGTREGGAVRFASGKVQEYRIVHLGVPMKGNLYVLFLKREEAGDFSILTGYELSNGLVTPLDGERPGLPFDYYKNVAESQFLQDLRSSIQRGGDK